MQTTDLSSAINAQASVSVLMAKPNLEIDVLAKLFDYIDYPVILVDTAGNLAWSNKQGSQALLEQRAVKIRDQKVVPALDVYQESWSRRLAAAAEGEEALLFIDDGSFGLAISFSPLSKTGVNYDGSERRVFNHLVIILGKNMPCEPLTLRRFSGSYKLTPAEQRVVAQLMAGLAPGKIALTNAVAETTIRTQIKSVLAKTGIANIRSLLLTVSRLPPVHMAR